MVENDSLVAFFVEHLKLIMTVVQENFYKFIMLKFSNAYRIYGQLSNLFEFFVKKSTIIIETFEIC